MTASNALVPYRPTPSSGSLSTRSPSLGLARVFTAQTGTAIATELLYRLLWDILQRLLSSLQGFASRRFDAFSAYLDTRYKEREALRMGKVEEELAKKKEGLGIVDAVEKMESEKKWGRAMQHRPGEFPGPACPLTGEPGRGPPGPPRWVKQAARGWSEAEWRVQVLGD